MTDALTSTGLTIDDLQTRTDAVIAEIRSEISALADLSSESPTGQLIRIKLERVQALAELLQSIYASFDPAQAVGRSLEAVSSITGTYRDPASKGTVTLTLGLAAATTVPAGSQAAVTGDPDNIWVLTADVTSVGAGNYAGAAEALEAGRIEAAAGTITTIVTPVVGWNSVTNAADATAGDPVETDTELRLRRETELALGGSTTVDAIQAEVSALDWTLYAKCYENDLPISVAPMPPNSIEVVIWTSANLTAAQVLELATLIFTEKAGGPRAYGSDIGDGSGDTYTVIQNAQGDNVVIGWTRATEQVLTITYDLTTNSDYEGDAAFSSAVAALFSAAHSVGDDILIAELIAYAMGQPGVENVVSTSITVGGGGPFVVDQAIGAREIATLIAGDITVI